QSISQGRLDGDLELGRGMEHVGHQAADAASAAAALLHDRPSTPGEALVALVDLLERHQPRLPTVELGAQRLDLGLGGLEVVAQDSLARLELFGLVAEIELGLLEAGQAVDQLVDLAIELVGPAVARLRLIEDDLEAPAAVVAPAAQGLALAGRPLLIGPGLGDVPAGLVELGLAGGQGLARLGEL